MKWRTKFLILKRPFFTTIIFAAFLIFFELFLIKNLLAQCFNNAQCNNDGNPCNGVEFCQRFSEQPGICISTAPPPNGTPCADSQFCNGAETCQSGSCVSPGNPCGGAQCNNSCDELNNDCFNPMGTPCTDADGNACTSGQCNGSGGCIGIPNNLTCNDGNLCTEPDTCSGGSCSGVPIQCNDTIACTLDSCDETTGECQFDSSQCLCQSDIDCEDNNPCTDEFCCTGNNCLPNELNTCIRSNNDSPCDDDLFCNGDDVCAGGTCSLHQGDPCTNGEECDQTCNEEGDNCFAPTGMGCEAGVCDGQGNCTTDSSTTPQGGRLGCSLDPDQKGPSETNLIIWIFSILTLNLFPLIYARCLPTHLH